eukprot:1576718-Pleurochrysis_carterae.AAC.2
MHRLTRRHVGLFHKAVWDDRLLVKDHRSYCATWPEVHAGVLVQSRYKQGCSCALPSENARVHACARAHACGSNLWS